MAVAVVNHRVIMGEYEPLQAGRNCGMGVEYAGGGNRTHTLLREPDFESGASASSATPAMEGIIMQYARGAKRGGNRATKKPI